MAMSVKEERAIREVLLDYDLAAKPRAITRNTIGLVNATFVVEYDEETFALRRLNRCLSPSQLALEVEVLRYLEDRKYEYSPRLVTNNRNEYLTCHTEQIYMLQRFIAGDVRVTMDNVTRFEGVVLRSFFEAVAGFSKVTNEFVPSGAYPVSTLSDYPRRLPAALDGVIERLPASLGSSVKKHKRTMAEFASRTLNELVMLDYERLPKQLVHFDFHPGNVHYCDEKIVGIFDYDTVRFDCRLSELAGAIAMSCHSRRGGALLRQKVEDGVAAYRKAYGPSEYDLKLENRILKAATEACIVAQALWAIDWYCDNYRRDNANTVLNHWINLCTTSGEALFG